MYDTYWRFATERQAIFFRRLAGAERLTEDPILARYKFTNAYRASDRVSQYLIKHVLYRGDKSPREIFFRALLFKFFNRVETWSLLEREFGEVSFASYRFEHYDRLLTRAMARGQRLYSAAYIMPAAHGFAGPRKHSTHLALLEHMIREDVPNRLRDTRSLDSAFELLRGYPMMGNFLAFQYIIDLNYSELMSFDEMDFVIAGPGARDGLKKCFASIGHYSEADVIRIVADRQREEFAARGLDFRDLWGRDLKLIDCQNLFCEVDKYARVAHPEIASRSGRVRIKQAYSPKAEPIELFYPPKWGLNVLIPNQCAPKYGRETGQLSLIP
ncbi:nucleotide kinase domain-containing protein [Sorangium sp. So ce1182]|uniref:nucleotide kinase domain-containing protein n=1 Tax=Sorangium sp. So ce1182 TaxID=3133334 RepID=UPI003F6384BA